MKKQTDKVQATAIERIADKDWVKSTEGQKALAKARQEAEAAIRELESSPPILATLVKRKFA
jgi:hypothetical protein